MVAKKVQDSKKPKSSSGHLSEKVEQAIETLPNMELARCEHLLSIVDDSMETKKENEDAKARMMNIIKDNNMSPYYESMCSKYNWKLDNDLLKQMRKSNEDELAQCNIELSDAKENLGDIEVLDALFGIATIYSRIGNKDESIQAFATAKAKPQSVNQKILISLHLIRLGFFFNDVSMVERNIKEAKQLVDEGGDWDRRNRLKVYEACYLLMIRDFQKASMLFQQSIATFTCEELMSFKTLVFYCIICSVLCSSRKVLKKNIVDTPEILTVLDDIPHAADFLNGIYGCNYQLYFSAIVSLDKYIIRDTYLSQHVRYIYREFRILAYAQFLEAYRSVKLASMAAAFGVGTSFIDGELARFIAAGRLNAKIDKVQGVIETNRPDAKNLQYQNIMKNGDHLLNRLQKLARVINV